MSDLPGSFLHRHGEVVVSSKTIHPGPSFPGIQLVKREIVSATAHSADSFCILDCIGMRGISVPLRSVVKSGYGRLIERVQSLTEFNLNDKTSCPEK